MKTLNDNKSVSLKGSLSEVEDIDLAKTITDLQLQQVAYQSALAGQRQDDPAVARRLPPVTW